MPFPGMFDEFGDWTEPAQFLLVTTTVVNFEDMENADTRPIDLIMYPMSPQRVASKPEGQRAWRFQLGLSDEDMKIGDIIIGPDKVKYRVMGKNAWRQAGYSEYELTQDYRP